MVAGNGPAPLVAGVTPVTLWRWMAPGPPRDRSMLRPLLLLVVLQPPPAGAVILFDGGDLDGWVTSEGRQPAGWTVDERATTAGPEDIETSRSFGDYTLHVEFNCPYEPGTAGVERGRGGIVLRDGYEVLVVDSYALPPAADACGAIVGRAAPRVVASKPPLQWQTFDVTFRAPRFDGPRLLRPARVRVVHNGITLIDERPLDPAPGEARAPRRQPIRLRGGDDLVKYRNVWIRTEPGD